MIVLTRLKGISRARVIQILNLLKLDKNIIGTFSTPFPIHIKTFFDIQILFAIFSLLDKTKGTIT
jgi:hypothetical protein